MWERGNRTQQKKEVNGIISELGWKLLQFNESDDLRNYCEDFRRIPIMWKKRKTEKGKVRISDDYHGRENFTLESWALLPMKINKLDGKVCLCARLKFLLTLFIQTYKTEGKSCRRLMCVCQKNHWRLSRLFFLAYHSQTHYGVLYGYRWKLSNNNCKQHIKNDGANDGKEKKVRKRKTKRLSPSVWCLRRPTTSSV